MKNTNILYWVITGIFAAFMTLTAIPDIMMVPEAVTYMNHLGYPNYFIPFIGVAKVLGAIAILIPGFPRLKEWAYAGLFFDLFGASYSAIAKDGFKPENLIMLIFFGFLFSSYFLYHKRLVNTTV